MTDKKKALGSIEKSFAISKADMGKIIRDFHKEMDLGLAGKESSLKMIPTYVDKPTGKEKGKFIALDLGGTNFRILELELMGNGEIGKPKIMKFALDRRTITGTGEGFFDFLADCLKVFMQKNGISTGEERRLGFTFSFPIKQTGVASGNLAYWTKGFEAKGVVGRDVVKLLDNSLARKGVTNIKISALANDTVGTLVARSYEDRTCDVGVILGTGTNACYPEKLANIAKWNGPDTRSGEMIINTEWGNFNKLHITSYDRMLDNSSDNPGQQILEKMVSGMYLGEAARLVIADLVKKRILFKGTGPGRFAEPKGIRAEDVSLAEGDRTRTLSKIGAFLETAGISVSGQTDRAMVKKVAGIVSRRAARISAAAIAAVVTKIDQKLTERHTIAIDGSVYEKHPGFSGLMKRALREIFGLKSSRIRMVLAKDGSGKGAAIIAAVASTK